MVRHFLYINDEINKVNIYESSIIAIDFSQYPTMLTFHIDWTEGPPIRLQFIDCIELDCDLSPNKDMKIPNLLINLEIQGFIYPKISNVYHAQLNFWGEPKGSIKIRCAGIQIITTSLPITEGGQSYSIYE